MALRYGYFDSEITGTDSEGMPIFDRAETSDLFAKFISNLVTSGIAGTPGTCFKVTAGSGMVLNVAAGAAIINGRFAYNNTSSTVTISAADASNPRIDLVILRLNLVNRLIELIVRAGTPAESPSEPAFTQSSDGDYYELVLAKVRVNAGVTSITASRITDTRANTHYCGIVAQLIDTIDFQSYFTQMQGAFDEWFAGVQSTLSGDTVGNLLNRIDAVQANVDAVQADVDANETAANNALVSAVTTLNNSIDSLSGTESGHNTATNARIDDAVGQLNNNMIIIGMAYHDLSFGAIDPLRMTNIRTFTVPASKIPAGATGWAVIPVGGGFGSLWGLSEDFSKRTISAGCANSYYYSGSGLIISVRCLLLFTKKFTES